MDGIAELARMLGKEGASETNVATATVVRVEGDTVWAEIEGGAGEFPCHRSTVECSPGDAVTVEFADGRATVTGSTSAPSISAARAGELMVPIAAAASEAQAMAGAAGAAAQSAQESAARAEVIVDTLDEMAEESGKTVEQILQDAGTAGTAAAQAQESADRAVYALSDVERVVGTVNWIAEHGEYVNQAGQTFDPTKVYYTRSGTSPNYVYTVVAEPVATAIASYYVLRVDESVQNFLASHIWMDSYGLNLSVDSANGYRIHQGTVDGQHSAGMYILDGSGDVVMTLNADGETIGKSDESHMELDYHSLKLIDKEGNEYFYASDLRDSSGNVEMVDTFIGNGTTTQFKLLFAPVTSPTPSATVNGSAVAVTNVNIVTHKVTLASAPANGSTIVITYKTKSPMAKAFTFGTRDANGKIGGYSFSSGYNNIASGHYSYAEGHTVTASGVESHAEGRNTTASGNYSHAECDYTVASGQSSHAEGSSTTASELSSHAEGMSTTASGVSSHAEGAYTTAGGISSHAEGYDTGAAGFYSHAQNEGTYTGRYAQTAIGTYNLKDWDDPDAVEPAPPTTHPSGTNSYGQYAVIVGNGTSDSARSNALAVTWDGDVDMAGDVRDMNGGLRYAPIAHGFYSGMSSSLSLTASAQKVPLNTFAGSGCTSSSNGIKVTEAGTYLISASLYFSTGFTVNDIVHVVVGLNGSSTVLATVGVRANNASLYSTYTCGPVIATLAANDVVYLYAYNQTGARGTAANRTGCDYLTVTRIA